QASYEAGGALAGSHFASGAYSNSLTSQSAMADINILAASFSLPMHDFQQDVPPYGGDDLSPDHFSPGYDNSQSSGMSFDHGHQQQQQHVAPQGYIDTYSFDNSYSSHQREPSKHSPYGAPSDVYGPGFTSHEADFYSHQQRYMDPSAKAQFAMDVSKAYQKHAYSEGSPQDLVFPQSSLAYSDLEQKPTHLYCHGAYDAPTPGPYCAEGPSLYQPYHPAFYGGQSGHCPPGMPFPSPGVPHGNAYRSDLSMSMSAHPSSHMHHSHRRTSLTIPTPPNADR
ncbi:unnamed protein product, partial [Lymnaea stagnalis]